MSSRPAARGGRSEGGKRGRRLDALCFAALVLAPCLWWHPMLSGMLPDFMDTVSFLYPLRTAIARQIHEGTLPLWLPNQFAGTPLAANPQLAAWYPLHLPFYAWPSPTTHNLAYLAHYWLAGIGAFALVRRLCGRHHRLAALFAGLSFQFGALLVGRIALPVHLYAAAWIPWMFWAVEDAVRSVGEPAPGRGALLAGLFFALQFLAGSPQFSYYSALALPLYWLLRAARRSGARGAWTALGSGFAAATLAAAISAAQLMPTLKLAELVERHPASPEQLAEQAINGEMAWRALVGFTAPEIEDTDTIHAPGLGVLALAAFALATRRGRRRSGALFAVAALGFVLSLGALVPIWSSTLPLYQGFHAPRRSLVLLAVAAPVAAGVGASTLAAIARRRPWPRWSYPSALAIALVGTLWLLPRLEREFADPARFDPPVDARANFHGDRFLALDPEFRYAHGSRRDDYGLSLMPNLAAGANLMDVQGYDPLVPTGIGLAREIASRRTGLFYPSHAALFTDPSSPILRLLNVQRLVGRFDLYEPGRVIPGLPPFPKEEVASLLVLESSHPRWPIWRYREKRPLAWTSARLLSVAKDEEAMIGAATGERIDDAIFHVDEGELRLAEAPPRVVVATWMDARTFRVALDQPVREPTPLAASIAWAPGWQARALPSGESLVLFEANGFSLGALLLPGVREMEFRYEPASFRRGLTGTLFGLLLFAAGWRRSRPTRRAGGRASRGFAEAASERR